MFNFAPPEIELTAVLPVVIVAITGIVGLIFEMIWPKRHNGYIVAASIGGLLLAALALCMQIGDPALETAGEMVVRDHFGTALQLVLVLGTGLSILFSEPYLREKRIAHGEFYPLLLWSTVGAMLMAGTRNLLMIFIGLEILSVSLYVLAGLSRAEEKSEESALKYFLLGAFASGFLLYGIALVYGGSGGLDLTQIMVTWHSGDDTRKMLVLLGIGLILVGLGFKSSLVPFHQWTPDVYQGAPTNVTSFMATGSKIGAIAALYRVLDAATPIGHTLYPVLAVVAVLTMTVGNLVALRQKDVKRILAYSSISHAGYILVALLAHYQEPNKVGSATTVYYLLSYSLMTIGAFAIVSMTAKSGSEGTRLEDLRGLWKRSPLAAMALIVFVASLIGLPPTAGFIGKLLIFEDAFTANIGWLAWILAANSIVSVYYYLAIAWNAVVPEPEGKDSTASLAPAVAGVSVICALGVLGACVFFAPLTNFLSQGPVQMPARPSMRASAPSLPGNR